MMVKICGLKTAADVAAAAEAGADAVGFVFAESVRRVTLAEAKQATKSIRRGVRRVAVMKQPSQAEVDAVMAEFAPDVLQTDVEDLGSLRLPEYIEVWPVFRQGVSAPRTEPVFLYEGQASGAGQTVDWSIARQAGRAGRMILAGGLDAGNVAAAIAEARPWGVDVSSGVESSPGQKDHAKILAFIDAARAAMRTL